jgi:hypothetical protein
MIILWSNENAYSEEAVQEAKEQLFDLSDDVEETIASVSDYEAWNFIAADLEFQLDELKYTLDKELEGRIIAIASLGLWNGRKQGFSLLDYNLSNCIHPNHHQDYGMYYLEGNEFKAKGMHHDGTNYITFRMIKNSKTMPDYEYNAFLQGIVNETVDIDQYTEPLGNIVREIFGLPID